MKTIKIIRRLSKNPRNTFKNSWGCQKSFHRQARKVSYKVEYVKTYGKKSDCIPKSIICNSQYEFDTIKKFLKIAA